MLNEWSDYKNYLFSMTIDDKISVETTDGNVSLLNVPFLSEICLILVLSNVLNGHRIIQMSLVVAFHLMKELPKSIKGKH